MSPIALPWKSSAKKPVDTVVGLHPSALAHPVLGTTVTQTVELAWLPQRAKLPTKWPCLRILRRRPTRPSRRRPLSSMHFPSSDAGTSALLEPSSRAELPDIRREPPTLPQVALPRAHNAELRARRRRHLELRDPEPPPGPSEHVSHRSATSRVLQPSLDGNEDTFDLDCYDFPEPASTRPIPASSGRVPRPSCAPASAKPVKYTMANPESQDPNPPPPLAWSARTAHILNNTKGVAHLLLEKSSGLADSSFTASGVAANRQRRQPRQLFYNNQQHQTLCNPPVTASSTDHDTSSGEPERSSQSSSQLQALDKFCKELESYAAQMRAEGRLPVLPSTTPSGTTLHTVAALLPFRHQFRSAGLAVTSHDQYGGVKGTRQRNKKKTRLPIDEDMTLQEPSNADPTQADGAWSNRESSSTSNSGTEIDFGGNYREETNLALIEEAPLIKSPGRNTRPFSYLPCCHGSSVGSGVPDQPAPVTARPTKISRVVPIRKKSLDLDGLPILPVDQGSKTWPPEIVQPQLGRRAPPLPSTRPSKSSAPHSPNQAIQTESSRPKRTRKFDQAPINPAEEAQGLDNATDKIKRSRIQRPVTITEEPESENSTTASPNSPALAVGVARKIHPAAQTMPAQCLPSRQPHVPHRLSEDVTEMAQPTTGRVHSLSEEPVKPPVRTRGKANVRARVHGNDQSDLDALGQGSGVIPPEPLSAVKRKSSLRKDLPMPPTIQPDPSLSSVPELPSTWKLTVSSPSSLDRALDAIISQANSPDGLRPSTIGVTGQDEGNGKGKDTVIAPSYIPERTSSMRAGAASGKRTDPLCVDRDDRDISDSDVLRGLGIAVSAACSAEVDAFIRNKTGLRLRRFLADLRAFENLGQDDQVEADPLARRRRREARRSKESKRGSRKIRL